MESYNKIYILAPYKIATGGVELAHQIIDFLRKKNLEAYVVYIENNAISENQDITKEYIKYNIKTTNHIEDSKNNFLILPEVFYDWIYKYKKIEIGCWWMSVDNHYKTCCFKDALNFQKGILNKLRYLPKYFAHKSFKNKISDLKKQEDRIWHFYQSHYAQFHLYSLGMSKVLPLSDYINTDFKCQISEQEKEDIILYNPKKGYEYISKLKTLMPNYEFKGLNGYNRDELKEIFKKSKLYIDFGNFPGKDRLPREAVANNCCIITGTKGASYFFEDIPISEKYKFNIDKTPSTAIIEMIKYVLNNYSECIKDFQFMKKQIENEESIFYREIEFFFICNKS